MDNKEEQEMQPLGFEIPALGKNLPRLEIVHPSHQHTQHENTHNMEHWFSAASNTLIEGVNSVLEMVQKPQQQHSYSACCHGNIPFSEREPSGQCLMRNNFRRFSDPKPPMLVEETSVAQKNTLQKEEVVEPEDGIYSSLPIGELHTLAAKQQMFLVQLANKLHSCTQQVVSVRFKGIDYYRRFQCEHSEPFAMFGILWQVVVFPMGGLYSQEGDASVYLRLANEQRLGLRLALVCDYSLSCSDLFDLHESNQCFRNGHYLSGRSDAFLTMQVPWNSRLDICVSITITEQTVQKVKIFESEEELQLYYASLTDTTSSESLCTSALGEKQDLHEQQSPRTATSISQQLMQEQLSSSYFLV